MPNAYDPNPYIEWFNDANDINKSKRWEIEKSKRYYLKNIESYREIARAKYKNNKEAKSAYGKMRK